MPSHSENTSAQTCVGLVGLGRWGKVLQKKLETIGVLAWKGGREILPICDKIKEDQRVNWIFVATSAASHFELCKEALYQDRNVFVEKPCTTSLEETKALFQIADERGLSLFVDTVFLWRSEWKDLKLKIRQGNVTHVSLTWAKYGQSDEAILDRLTYHHLYLLADILGEATVGDVQVQHRGSNGLTFSCIWNHVPVNFRYDLTSKTTIHTIDVETNSCGGNKIRVDFSSNSPHEDPLLSMLDDVLRKEHADFTKNRQVVLAAESARETLTPHVELRVNVIGGGIFGVTAAWVLAEAGFAVNLFESKADILMCASEVNQRRLHRGYHYPRSDDTAESSRDGQESFKQAYGTSLLKCVQKHYYCIAKEGSKTSAKQMTDFCERLRLPYAKSEIPLIRPEKVDLVIEASEDLWDHEKLRAECWNKLKRFGVKVHLNSEVALDGRQRLPPAQHTIVACYAANNALLGKKSTVWVKEYQYELCEKPVFRLPKEYHGMSCVVMDGPFMCIDPISDADPSLFVMGNVVHAIHSTNVGEEPFLPDTFKALLNQGVVPLDRIPQGLSRAPVMLDSASQFFIGLDEAQHVGSMFTFRTVLPRRDHDDARPSIATELSDDITSIFSGKIVSCVDVAINIRDRLLSKKKILRDFRQNPENGA
ncbi:FAD dependent oxidoreductase domain-containing protein [Pseudoscourfieldia marina]